MAATALPGKYEIIYSPYKSSETYTMMEEALKMQSGLQMDTKNLIDVDLWLNFLMAKDNSGTKNMFYVLTRDQNAYQLALIPWDTDLTIGLGCSVSEIVHRIEYEQLYELYPQIYDLSKDRWRQLRESFLNEKVIERLIANEIDQIVQSGAYQRDLWKWGAYYEGDTWWQLLYTCTLRLEQLDQYYQVLDFTVDAII